LYASPNIIRVIKSRRMRWMGHVVYMGEMRNAYNILVDKPDRERPAEIPTHRWKDTFRMDLKEIEWESVDWTCMSGSG
jgi:hypothetical protein